MSEINITMGPVQVPESKLKKWICSPFRALAGTSELIRRTENLEIHTRALTDIFYIILADQSWSPEKLERVLRATTNFNLVKEGLGNVKPKGNPFTAEELNRLQYYTDRARQGQSFQPEEAQDYRQLSERAAREYPGQQWVAELMKVALFIFALYAIGKLLEPSK